MNKLILKSRLDGDGVLRVAVPFGPAAADQDLQLTIEPAAATPMSQEEWRKFVLATAGSVTDPTFVRHPQGDYEIREKLP